MDRVELTSFVGRAAELADLARLVTGARLVTLTGAGGSGKTRLASELMAREQAGGSRVVWVELAALADPGRIPQRVAGAFGVRDEIADADALAVLLRASDGLLVLDNCEHLVDGCAALVHTLLRAAPSLRVLATSREPLGVPGERAWLVPPLGLPSDTDDPRQAASSEAVRLFVDRARDVVADFELDERNAAAVVEICRRLDGIPLAIELAAARVRVLTPEQIRQRLDDAFQLLTGNGRQVLPRHRTLRATMDWSHDLLVGPARVLLRRQGVFRGGFTLEAAEEVCAGDGIEQDEVLDLVARLVDRSLLGVREHAGSARYGALETVRQYALERLAESGEEEAVRRRHAAAMLRRAEAAAVHANTGGRRAAFEALLPEMENLREALRWTRAQAPRDHVRLVGQLGWFWFSVGHWKEARGWVEGALALPEAATADLDRARLLFAGGAMAALQADAAAARPWLEESAALAAAAGAGDVEAYALNYLGMTYVGAGDVAGGAFCARAEAWFRAHGDDYGLRLALLLLGMVAQAEGRQEDAIRVTEEAVAVARRFGQDRELSVSLQNLAITHIMQGRVEAAEPLLLEALAAVRRDPSYFFIATTLDGLGEVRLHQGRVAEAGRILGAADATRETIGAARFPVNQRRIAARLESVRRSEDAAAFDEAVRGGRGLRVNEILDEVLAGGPATTPSREPTGAGATAGTPAPAPARAAVLSPVPSSEGAGDVPDLRIAALGPLEVTRRGEPLPADVWAYAKPKELLVYLALNPAGRTREQIGRAMWPGASAGKVKNSFHVTLHHLRRTLGGAEWVVIEADRYRLSPGIRCVVDADGFEQEGRAALRDAGAGVERLRAVLALYRGELLEGEVTGPWVEEERDRYRRLAVELGLALGAALDAAGDAAGAAETYHAIAAREELNEEAHRRLMRTLGRTGDRARAIRHYERLVSLLREELDAEPEAETVAVYESLRGARAAAT